MQEQPDSNKITKYIIATALVTIFVLAAIFLWPSRNTGPDTDRNASETAVNNNQKVQPLSSEEIATMQRELEEQRRSSIANAVEKIRKENQELYQTPFRDYTGVPSPKEDDVSIQTYSEVITSHSGNHVLYYLRTYSKLQEELNDYAGELGTKNIEDFDCNKLSKKCVTSTIVEKAAKANLPGYQPGTGSCFAAWDAEKERMISSECGAPENQPASQYNYGENKFYQFSSQNENWRFLAVNNQMTRIAVDRSSNENYFGHTNAILIFNTDNPSVPEKIVDLEKFIDYKYAGIHSSAIFKWDEDGNTALVTLQEKNYILNAVTGTVEEL